MPTLQEPSLWSSINRPVVYKYLFDSYYFTGVIDSGGFARMAISPADIGNFSLNQRVRISSGLYAGNWSITAIGANYIILNTAYIINTIGAVYPLSNVSVELWAGYDATHPYYANNPERKIADIIGVPALEPYAEINVAGFLKGLFKKITPPVIGPDFAMSTPFFLKIGATTYTKRYALNGTFEDQVLNNLNSNYAILNARTPIHFKDNQCLYSMIRPNTDPRGAHIINIIGMNGAANFGGLGFDAIGSTFVVG